MEHQPQIGNGTPHQHQTPPYQTNLVPKSDTPNRRKIHRIALTPPILGVLCLFVAIVILSLGLWPFHIPANAVTWLDGRDGLRFGPQGTAIASGLIPPPRPGPDSGATVEICLQPRRIWDGGTFLAFYAPELSSRLLFRQSETDLEIEAPPTGPGGTAPPHLYVGDVFRKPAPRFLTITTGSTGLRIYLDGRLVRASRFQLSPADFTGRLIVGTAPGDTDSWQGNLFTLAIYHRELHSSDVARHYAAWIHQELPNLSAEGSVAFYPMQERAGRIVHDRSGNGLDLFLPERYVVLDQASLKPFWQEFELSRSYGSSAVKNVIGFVPFGCSFFAWLSALRLRRAALIAVLLGTAASATIEILQAYLPVRDSGTTDILTNTFGTWLGVVTYRLVAPLLSGRFPWFPFVISGLADPRGGES